jgi:predicted esterase
MKSYLFFFLLLILCLANLRSQTLYYDKIYSKDQIDLEEDVVYAEIEPYGFLYQSLQSSDIISRDTQMVSLIKGWLGKKLHADIYSPPKDVPLRPLILFFHGGGFVLGNRNETVAKTFCGEFARRGFITASVGYRQSGITELSLKRAGYSATQDARAAVRFFRKNASKFGIDPNYIYTAGESTGAVVALHAAFLDQSELFSNLGLEIDKHLGCLDCIGVENEDPRPRAVFSISGGVVDLKIMDNNDIPVALFHGTADRVINPKKGLPREELSKSYLNLKDQVKGALGIRELPKIDSLYGSELIYERLQELRVESLYDPIPGVGHHLISSDRGTMRNTAQHIFSKYPDIFRQN